MTRYELVTFEKLLKFWKNFWILKFPRRRKFEFSGSKKAFNLIIDPDKIVYQIEVYVVSDTKVTSKKHCMTHHYDVFSGWLRRRFVPLHRDISGLKTFALGYHEYQRRSRIKPKKLHDSIWFGFFKLRLQSTIEST